jgi:predicted GTPase
MVKLAQNDIKVIEQYCGYDYAQRCRGILERRADKTVRIVNTGMVSSGKSSLFNTLINSTDEYFPTGAARTTTRADFFDCNNISYIDTPGIDVRSEDDALAFSTIMEADIIIMVHNIRTGPLE